MKNILYLAFIFLFITDLKGQSFALNTLKDKQDFTNYSQSNFIAFYNRPAPPNALMVVGGCSIGIGIGVAFYGLIVEYDAYSAVNVTTDQSRWQKGNRILFAGGAITIAGIGMVIAGGIQYHKDYHHRWGMIVTKKDEVGLAYNF